MNSGDLRDAWTRLQLAKEAVEDVSVLIGASDREQTARLRKLMEGIESEVAVLAQKTEAMRQAEKAARKQGLE